MSRFHAIYHVRSDARSIEARAQAIAVEQSVEMPLSAIEDQSILDEIVGKVEAISDLGSGTFAVRIALARATAGNDAGQLINMLFGNTSLQEDAVLQDAEFPDDVVAAFGGPNTGLAGLRDRAGAGERALTCSALKPQGLSPARLADLAARFARGGIDYIKDDHGLADQSYSPFAARCEAVAKALRESGAHARYVPSLTGDLDALRAQISAAKSAGIDTVMVQPMIMGLSNFSRLVAENRDLAFFAHSRANFLDIVEVICQRVVNFRQADCRKFGGNLVRRQTLQFSHRDNVAKLKLVAVIFIQTIRRQTAHSAEVT